jgi:hypothetical protein
VHAPLLEWRGLRMNLTKMKGPIKKAPKTKEISKRKSLEVWGKGPVKIFDIEKVEEAKKKILEGISNNDLNGAIFQILNITMSEAYYRGREDERQSKENSK